MKAERRAEVTWEGDLKRGSGTIHSTGSGALGKLPVTWASRTERSDGKTSPEELIAAAHAACYAMIFSDMLAKAGTPPTKLIVNANCAFEEVKGGFKITTIYLNVRGQVPGMDHASFAQAASKAEQSCPVSNALRNNVQIRLTSHLEEQRG
ncbi:MAG: OsmC family peroxiredoxin [Ktedonobacteraceae bacterium]|nr:OsmC family peroxiredoxin [Ktedonobacteraceae bacterium]MBV8821527.1 OsmC family peroxiredoxin [Ktedonobacteraceae bacterium]MBV9019720.1 OsmC family peroxiredoxin [Ktedonobacteraceae bacterium]